MQTAVSQALTWAVILICRMKKRKDYEFLKLGESSVDEPIKRTNVLGCII